ncbi:MAG: hypothetical protein KDB61_15680, partial [Planctomycetes bacterium]|nr:hypothetical protein [Planctomycetota bacterium]
MKVIEQLKSMEAEQFLPIYEALAQDGFGPLDGEVAKELKFRPQAIKKLPFAQRAKRAQLYMERTGNAQLCYELFGSYLMQGHKQLVIDFLDATGVNHKDGMLEDGGQTTPEVAKLSDAIAELDKKYAPSDVTLYLAMCAEQWPEVP